METSGRQKQDLSLNTEIVKRLLVDFLRDESRKAGFERAVLGLSGGVDSAVVAYLAAEALGRGNVRGVMMPYRTSSPQSKADAELIIGQLGIAHELVDITPMVDSYLSTANEADKVRQGNIMARQRMIVLYDISARDRSLVIGTSNKTELMLGYGTLFGDMACALNPLGDLYKTQVWQLAMALDLPKTIIQKEPSADLWEGQTDEGELGMTYEKADKLLYAMIDERRSVAELRGMGFEGDFIRRIGKLVMVNQFKRRPPVIAKVSHRTINIDFRYPRDWGI
jgi:NAD+ synthase